MGRPEGPCGVVHGRGGFQEGAPASCSPGTPSAGTILSGTVGGRGRPRTRRRGPRAPGGRRGPRGGRGGWPRMPLLWGGLGGGRGRPRPGAGRGAGRSSWPARGGAPLPPSPWPGSPAGPSRRPGPRPWPGWGPARGSGRGGWGAGAPRRTSWGCSRLAPRSQRPAVGPPGVSTLPGIGGGRCGPGHTRPHRALHLRPPVQADSSSHPACPVLSLDRLGGVLHEYTRRAA